MGVARRQAPTLTYYLYPLHRADPSRHALACPHGLRGAMREEGDRPNERAGVVQSIGGRIRVNLAAPIFQRSSVLKASAPGDVEEDPPPNEESPSANESRARPPKGTLLTLLQLLWTEAELNTWRPGFAGRRHYSVVAKRLAEAARFVEVKSVALEPLFMVPPPFRDDEAHRRACDQSLRNFLDALRPDRKGRRYFGFAAGLLRGVTRPSETSAALQLAHMGKPVWLSANHWRRLSGTFWPGLDEGKVAGECSFLLLRVSRQEGRPAPWLQCEDLAALRLLDTRTWLPAATPAHRTLVGKLVEEGRQFRCPLSLELEADRFLPDAVLEDRGDRAYVKMLASDVEQRNRAQADAARAHWEAQGQAVCWWDPSHGAKASAVLPKEF